MTRLEHLQFSLARLRAFQTTLETLLTELSAARDDLVQLRDVLLLGYQLGEAQHYCSAALTELADLEQIVRDSPACSLTDKE